MEEGGGGCLVSVVMYYVSEWVDWKEKAYEE